MKKALFIIYVCLSFIEGISQKNVLSDSILEANSEKWKIKENNKMFGGIHKPEFGPYIIPVAEKLDSPVIKRKTRGGAEFDLKLGYDAEMETGRGADLDVNKKVTTEKTKYYHLQLVNGVDTTESLFSVLFISTEQRQTLLGKMLSNKDEGKDKLLSYSVDINGIILTNEETITWKFFYSSTNNGNISASIGATTSNIFGYLKGNNDSFYIHPIIDSSIISYKELFSSKRDTIKTYQRKGIVLLDQNGKQVATLEFNGPDQKRYLWIRKDIESTLLRAVSTYMAVIIAI